jgi:hypothetical protein
MPIVIWENRVTPISGDYCPIDRFHGLKSNGMKSKGVSKVMKSTIDAEGWVGYTGNKRCIISGYV